LFQNHGLENFHGNGERFVLKLAQNEECVGNFQITANDHIIKKAAVENWGWLNGAGIERAPLDVIQGML